MTLVVVTIAVVVGTLALIIGAAVIRFLERVFALTNRSFFRAAIIILTQAVISSLFLLLGVATEFTAVAIPISIFSTFFVFYFLLRRWHKATAIQAIGMYALVIFFVPILVTIPLLGVRFVFEPYFVRQDGLTPTLQNNDYVITYRFSRDITRRDIVVTDEATDFGNAIRIMRVVGVPGETIAVTNGQILINNQPRAESYFREPDVIDQPPHKLARNEYALVLDRPVDAPTRTIVHISASNLRGKVIAAVRDNNFILPE